MAATFKRPDQYWEEVYALASTGARCADGTEQKPLGHTAFQIEAFMTKPYAAEDRYAQYRQVLREIHARVGVLLERYQAYDQAYSAWESAKIRGMGSNMEKAARLRLQLVDGALRDTIREVQQLIRLKNQLYMDEYADPVRVRELEKRYWTRRLLWEAALDLKVEGRVRRQTAEAIYRLPREERKAVLKALKEEPAEKLLEEPQVHMLTGGS